MKKRKTILLTGTHHTPAIELIHQLKSDSSTDWNIHYIGQISSSDTHIKETLLPMLKENFHHLESGKFDRRWLPYTIKGIPKTIAAIFTTYQLLKTIKPDIVVSFGSFISVPVVISAFVLGIPSLTHEQTSTLSLSTRINRFFVKKVALSFDSPHFHPKHVVTGNLLRRDIFDNKSPKYQFLTTRLEKHPLIYITGGHLGSSFFNHLIEEIAPQIVDKYTIIHQTGATYQSPLKLAHYYPVAYVNHQDIGWVLHQASFIISRSGANICQEIVALNKASILIPLPVSQQNEQLINARWVKSHINAHTIISLQKDTTASAIMNQLHQLQQLPPLPPKKKASPNLSLLHLIHETIN